MFLKFLGYLPAKDSDDSVFFGVNVREEAKFVQMDRLDIAHDRSSFSAGWTCLSELLR